LSRASKLLVAPALGLLAAAPGAAQDVPDLAALTASGFAIGQIRLEIDNVFDLSNPEENKRLYRWANRVHRTTRPSVIESILLFDSGDALNAQLIEETARLLRERGFIADATITVANVDPAANTADINVKTRDAWTLEPDIKLSRKGGENEYGIGIKDQNLFGLGKAMSLSYESTVDRDQRIFGYSDSNLRNSRKRLGVTVADFSDGRQFQFSTGRPFYALDTRWSVEGAVLDDERVDPIYDLGETIDEFRHDTSFLSIRGGRSRGLIDGVTLRWLAGLDFEEDQFRPNPGFGPPLLLPEDRKLIFPWAGFQRIADDFRRLEDLNDMGRTEDIALGLNLFARVGVASPNLSSDRRAVLFEMSASRGWEPGGTGRLMLLSASAQTRLESDAAQNTVITLGGRYAHSNFTNGRFFATLNTVVANRLDAENQVLLGGDSNLRGYPLRYQSGEKSAIVNIEQRFYTDWYPFRLVRVGYAFFFDAGRVWGDRARNTSRLGTLYDVGMGLRLTSPRSSGGSVVHLDLAFPIDAPPDIDNMQLIVERKSSF
jgi:hypothetical protein